MNQHRELIGQVKDFELRAIASHVPGPSMSCAAD
jgi:hypothetical protein